MCERAGGPPAPDGAASLDMSFRPPYSSNASKLQYGQFFLDPDHSMIEASCCLPVTWLRLCCLLRLQAVSASRVCCMCFLGAGASWLAPHSSPRVLHPPQVCDCHQLPLVPKELDLHRCRTCALEAARLHEEAGDASPRAAAAAAAAAAAPAAAPCCGTACGHQAASGQQAAAGRCSSTPGEEFAGQAAGADLWAGEAEAMCMEGHAEHAELHAGPHAEAPCRRSMDSGCSDTCAS